MIYKKADDIFISLESCKNCLFHIKSRDRESPILENLMMELSQLAEQSLHEIKQNRDHNNPRFCLRDPIKKYYEQEENAVFRLLWFLRDLWHHLFNATVQMTSYEAMNFLLDQRYYVSRFIPALFRFVQKHLRPEFDVWLGRSFLNLIPCFSGDFLQNSEEKLVYIRTSEMNDKDEHIPLSVPGNLSYDDFSLLVSKETNIRLFELTGMHENVTIRMKKISDVQNRAIVIVKQTDVQLESRINKIISSFEQEKKFKSKADDIFKLVQTKLPSTYQKESRELTSLYFRDRFYFVFKLLKMTSEERKLWESHFDKVDHPFFDLIKFIFQQEEPIPADSESPLSSQI
jgi:hypothetical protein